MLPTKRNPRPAKIGAAFVALALVATACGGDDDPADAGASDQTTADDGASTDATDTTGTSDTTTAEGAGADAPDDADPNGDATTIRWFVGLGTGSQEDQQAPQLEVVDAFNAAHPDINLEVEFVDNDTAISVLAPQIAAGNAPDIIGPVGIEGSNAFAGEYLGLDDMIESTGFDLSAYDEAQVEFWRDPESGELTSLPFATYPSAIFYNKELFDAAGLPHPPNEYGPDGTAVYGEGTEYEGVWDWAKVEELAMLMTVDANGNNATEDGFDKDDTVQWGYDHQWTEPPRAQGSFWGSGDPVADDGTADFPDPWVAEWKWYHEAIHDKGFVPDQVEQDAVAADGNMFAAGVTAMANTHLWYTCCIFDGDGNAQEFWDLAIVPSHDGNVVSKLHADTFRVYQGTEHPDEAFEVLSYFQTEGMLDLLAVYGGMPPRADLQADYFSGLEETFPQGVDWDVIIASQAFPDDPSHESLLPEPHTESLLLIQELESSIKGDPALDIDTWVADTEAALNELWGAG